jgi:hypothetical protein
MGVNLFILKKLSMLSLLWNPSTPAENKQKEQSMKKASKSAIAEEEIERIKTVLIQRIADEKGVPASVFDRERTLVKFREDGTPYLAPK